MSSEQRKDPERDLWGNGRLTVGARIASVVGWPVATLLLGLLTQLATELRHDVRSLKDEKVALAATLAGINARLDERARWDGHQDNRIDRLERRPISGQ